MGHRSLDSHATQTLHLEVGHSSVWLAMCCVIRSWQRRIVENRSISASSARSRDSASLCKTRNLRLTFAKPITSARPRRCKGGQGRGARGMAAAHCVGAHVVIPRDMFLPWTSRSQWPWEKATGVVISSLYTYNSPWESRR